MSRSSVIFKIILVCLVLAALVMFASVARDYFALLFSGTDDTAAPAETPPPTIAPTPMPTPTPKPVPEDVRTMMEYIPPVRAEMDVRFGMFGRLVMPDSGINVALFTDGEGETIAEKRQGVTDAEDSAALYYDEEGAVIADHNNQGFAALINVRPGQKAYIITSDSVLELVCSRLIDGHNNNHKGLVDENYEPIRNAGDFICYTCKETWLDVRIAALDIIDEYFIDE